MTHRCSKLILPISVCFFLMLLASNSFAKGVQQTYISGNLAVTEVPTINFAVIASGAPIGVKVKMPFQEHISGGMALGAKMSAYRIEGALDYFKNNVKPGVLDIADFGSSPIGLTGSMTVIALLLNSYYDFNDEAVCSPYVGWGLGLAKIHPNIRSFLMDGSRGGVDNSTNKFAYQGMVGASWKLSERMKTNLDYRYFRTLSAKLGTSSDQSGQGQIKGVYANNRISFGVSYSFE